MGRISFQKRQKEMKRQEKQQMKAERRAQRKLAKAAGLEPGAEQPSEFAEAEGFDQEFDVPAVETEPQP
jgi:hypothetical protein